MPDPLDFRRTHSPDPDPLDFRCPDPDPAVWGSFPFFFSFPDPRLKSGTFLVGPGCGSGKKWDLARGSGRYHSRMQHFECDEMLCESGLMFWVRSSIQSVGPAYINCEFGGIQFSSVGPAYISCEVGGIQSSGVGPAYIAREVDWVRLA